MNSIDTTTMLTWLITGFIGFVFGSVSAWLTYRYERKRDDIAWEREKEKRKQEWDLEQEKMRQQWKHEAEMFMLQFQQETQETEQQRIQQEQSRIRSELLKDVGDPKTLDDLIKLRKQLESDLTQTLRSNSEDVYRKLHRDISAYLGEGVERWSEERKVLNQFIEGAKQHIDMFQKEEVNYQRMVDNYIRTRTRLDKLTFRAIAVGIWIGILLLGIVALK